MVREPVLQSMVTAAGIDTDDSCLVHRSGTRPVGLSQCCRLYFMEGTLPGQPGQRRKDTSRTDATSEQSGSQRAAHGRPGAVAQSRPARPMLPSHASLTRRPKSSPQPRISWRASPITSSPPAKALNKTVFTRQEAQNKQRNENLRLQARKIGFELTQITKVV